MTKFPDCLKAFVIEQKWTFAKTYAVSWPHEYIVRDHVDEEQFLQLVRFIRAHGYEGKFYQESFTYFEDGGMVYWTMGEPIEETTVINRCRKDDTYEERLKKGMLPTMRCSQPRTSDMPRFHCL
ncbi:MAG: hypothetical protein H0T83_08690 [Chthoniobacterales bacterium]|nr:hypothetical protein [Chthoniobacterales bacterium]